MIVEARGLITFTVLGIGAACVAALAPVDAVARGLLVLVAVCSGLFVVLDALALRDRRRGQNHQEGRIS